MTIGVAPDLDGDRGELLVTVTSQADTRIDELVLRWSRDLGETFRLAPFVPSEERIRDGGPPLVQAWTKWVVGPGEQGEPAGTISLGYGPLMPGATLTMPLNALRLVDGPIAFDLQVLARNAILATPDAGAGGDPGRGALMPAILPAWTDADPALHDRLTAAIDPDRKVLAALERIVPLGGKRIADIGTGIGHFPMLLARRTGRTYGIESDPDLLAEARRRAGRVASAEHPDRRGPGDPAPAPGWRGGCRPDGRDRSRRHLPPGDRRGDARAASRGAPDRHRLLRTRRRRRPPGARDRGTVDRGDPPSDRLVAAPRLQDQGRPRPRRPDRHRARPRDAAAAVRRSRPRLPHGAARELPATQPRALPPKRSRVRPADGSSGFSSPEARIPCAEILASADRRGYDRPRPKARLFSPRSLAFGMSAREAMR